LKPSQKRRGRRVVVDTSVVIAGISAFKSSSVRGKNPSADTLREWVENSRFIWLVTSEILEEYKAVAKRLNVRPNVAGRLVNLLKEEAEEVSVRKTVEISPDPDDNCFCTCAEEGRADFLITLNRKDFPQGKLSAKVVSPARFLEVIRREPTKE
jgi:putative PIN family toxin of toxin-antitoxin system